MKEFLRNLGIAYLGNNCVCSFSRHHATDIWFVQWIRDSSCFYNNAYPISFTEETQEKKKNNIFL